MSQNPPNGTITVGSQLVASGLNSSLNITAAKVIKVGAGRVVTICTPAISTFTINDCATTGAAVTANVIHISGTTAIGQVFKLDFPFTAGLVVSAVTGTISIAYT